MTGATRANRLSWVREAVRSSLIMAALVTFSFGVMAILDAVAWASPGLEWILALDALLVAFCRGARGAAVWAVALGVTLPIVIVGLLAGVVARRTLPMLGDAPILGLGLLAIAALAFLLAAGGTMLAKRLFARAAA
jgi:hypothetical protein